jgi:hypothetical protein
VCADIAGKNDGMVAKYADLAQQHEALAARHASLAARYEELENKVEGLSSPPSNSRHVVVSVPGVHEAFTITVQPQGNSHADT